MARDDTPYTPSGPGQDATGGGPAEGGSGDAVLAAIAHRLRARSERQQLLTERLRSGELRPGALADLAELAGAARRGARDGDHILVLAGARGALRSAAPSAPLGQVLGTVVAASEVASRTVVPPTPSVAVDASAEPVLAQILAELLAHAAAATPPGERLEMLSRWGPEGGVVVELQATSVPRYQTPVDELDHALRTATPAGPVAPQEIGLHVAARLARAIGARLGVRGATGNSGGAPVAVLDLPTSILGGGRAPEQAPPRAEQAAVPRPQPDRAPDEPPWPPRPPEPPRNAPPPAHAPAPASAEEPPPSWPPVAPARSEGLPQRAGRGRSAIASATPFGTSGGNDGSGPQLPVRAPGQQSDQPPAAAAGPPAPADTGAPPARPDGLPQRVPRSGRREPGVQDPGAPSSPGRPQNSGPLPATGNSGQVPATGNSGQLPATGNGQVPATGNSNQVPAPGNSGPLPASGASAPGHGGPPSTNGGPLPVRGAPTSGGGRPPTADGVPPAAGGDTPSVTQALPVSRPAAAAPPAGPSLEADALFGPFDSEVPVRVDDSDDPPIFAAVASAWFRDPVPATPDAPGEPRAEDWRTPGDAEFEAARIRADRVVDLPTTAQGLPQRLPGQSMVPPSWRDNPEVVQSGASRERQPDRVRSRLASYQRGLQEGRHRANEAPADRNGAAVNGRAGDRNAG